MNENQDIENKLSSFVIIFAVCVIALCVLLILSILIPSLAAYVFKGIALGLLSFGIFVFANVAIMNFKKLKP